MRFQFPWEKIPTPSSLAYQDILHFICFTVASHSIANVTKAMHTKSLQTNILFECDRFFLVYRSLLIFYSFLFMKKKKTGITSKKKSQLVAAISQYKVSIRKKSKHLVVVWYRSSKASENWRMKKKEIFETWLTDIKLQPARLFFYNVEYLILNFPLCKIMHRSIEQLLSLSRISYMRSL